MAIHKTTIEYFPSLNSELGMELYFASEIHQVTHSFKFRAAWSVVENISAPGFLAASSGNFGQALAKACQIKGRKCIIVMPMNSAKIKINAVLSHGAHVELVDTNQKSRAERVSEIALEYPEYYIASAYDCEHVISGNASLGIEIAELEQEFDVIVAPVGGGGLTAGIITGLESKQKNIPVWGAEPAVADDLFQSFRIGSRQFLDKEPITLADGAKTLSEGERNWAILSKKLQGVLRVSEASITKAVQMLWSQGLRVEPTGALSLGALFDKKEWSGKRILAVISGGNVDQDLFLSLIQEESKKL